MEPQPKRIISNLTNGELAVTLFIPYYWRPAEVFLICVPIYIKTLDEAVKVPSRLSHVLEQKYIIKPDGVYMSIRLPALAFQVHRYYFVFECADKHCQTVYDVTDDKYVKEMFCICRFF